MKAYCQTDERWGALRIASTQLTLARYGCFVVSLAMIDGRTPAEILAILNRNQCFDRKGRLLSDQAAKVLKLVYEGKRKDPPLGKQACIAETDFYAHLGKPQHFFVWLGTGLIIDPVDGRTKTNPFKIKSFRLFRKDGEAAPAQPPKAEVRIVVEKNASLVERILGVIQRILKAIIGRLPPAGK